MIRIKLVKADKKIEGMTLNLEFDSEALYICKKSGIRIIDGLEELLPVEANYASYVGKEYFNVPLFSDSFGPLAFIQELKILQIGKLPKSIP